MGEQISQFFNRFYQITIKESINDPIIHSEWMYFLSMFKHEHLEKERIQLYLGILNNEKKKKKEQQERDQQVQHLTAHIHHQPTTNNQQPTHTLNLKARPQSKAKLINSGQNQINMHQLKLEKRYSQNLKPSFNFLQSKPESESLALKKMSNQFDDSQRYHKKSIDQQSKSMRAKNNQTMYALPTAKGPNCMTYLKAKCANQIFSQIRQSKQKQKYLKLSQISKRLMGIFQSTNKLRS